MFGSARRPQRRSSAALRRLVVASEPAHACFQEQRPDEYPELLATLRDVAYKLAAPANADEVEGSRILRQAAPGLMDSIAALGPELEG